MKYLVRIEEAVEEVEVTEQEDGTYRLQMGDRVYEVNLRQVGAQNIYSLLIDGVSHQLHAELAPPSVEILLKGEQLSLFVAPKTAAGGMASFGDAGTGPLQVKAPMPGVVNDIYVTPGQAVERGDRLLLLEAMKMNNEIRAPRSGVVQEVRVEKGQRVNKDDVLVAFE